MTGEAEARHVGHRMNARDPRNLRPRRVQRSRRLDHPRIAPRIQHALLQRHREDADADALAEDQHIPRLRARVALHLARVHKPDGDKAIDRLD